MPPIIIFHVKHENNNNNNNNNNEVGVEQEFASAYHRNVDAPAFQSLE